MLHDGNFDGISLTLKEQPEKIKYLGLHLYPIEIILTFEKFEAASE